MTPNLRPIQTACAIALNLVIPGAGLIVQGRLRWAIYTQLALILTVSLLCWSRLVFEPAAVQIFSLMIVLIYLVSTLLCLLHFSARRTFTRPTVISAFCFTLVCFGVWTPGFFYKQAWLGVEIYFVPSDSMTPTLNPGEFILVDTWAYRIESPSEGDVVVFLYDPNKEWLVKRIATWPSGDLTESGRYYLLGDNSPASRDSRYFGGIPAAQIAGKVRMVLLGIDSHRRILPESLLRRVD